MNYVIKNIEIIRKSRGVTKAHIGSSCNKTGAWYGDIVKGRRRVYLNDLLLIAAALNVDVKIFFDQKLSETLNSKKTA
ncbi:helix-turn-helix domain-containing protein [Paenibacillus sp. FSL R10-2771]|jgi:transcriptional regulator with XRE-family HTH domain|uniref:helix-turn-helix domain-containing protein n=1 Tax=Paenibacillus sp. FSL R10-2771 TaxID=2954693 RepID=UPI0030F8D98D